MKDLSISAWWRNQDSRYGMVGFRCLACKEICFPKRGSCLKCCNNSFEEINLSGKGKLISYTTIHSAPDGFEGPYVLGIIQLEEGPLVTGQIVNPTEEIKIGSNVKVVFRKLIVPNESSFIVYGYKFELI